MSTFTIKEKVREQTMEDADAILLQAVIKYKELQAKISFLQNELKATRMIIEPVVKVAPNMEIINLKYKITYTPTTSLDSDAMIKVFGRKSLAGFITETVDRAAVARVLGEEKVARFIVPTGKFQLRVS